MNKVLEFYVFYFLSLLKVIRLLLATIIALLLFIVLGPFIWVKCVRELLENYGEEVIKGVLDL